MISVRLFQNNAADAAAWDSFVMSHPASTSDHLWAWRRILADSFGFTETFYLGAERDGRLCGILPVYRIAKGFKRSALISIPFGNYGGIVAEDDAAAEALLQEAEKLMRKMGSKYLELRHKEDSALAGLQSTGATHHRYFWPLQDSAANWKKLGQNNRSKVQRARKRGLEMVCSRDSDLLYPIYTHTARRQGVPCFPKSYFKSILREFGEKAEIYFVTMDKQPVGYYLVLHFKNTMVGQFAGSLSDAYSAYPNEFLFWNAIEKAVSMGLTEFDFCRSRTQSGTAEFKRKLRFEEAPCNSQYILKEKAMAYESSNAKSKFRLLSDAWQHLPVKVTESLGPLVLRYFA